MSDLTFRRGATSGPVKMVCMYCGAPASHLHERRVTNPRLDPPAGSGSGVTPSDVPRGDDPLSGCLSIVLLVLVLIGIGQGARDAAKHRAALREAPPLDPSHTVVTITTCDRHRRFGRRFVVAGVIGLFVLACGWGAMLLPAVREPLGPPLWLVMTVLIGTIAFPIVLLMEYAGHGPVRVSRVGRDEVVLSEVRQAYFDAPG